MASFTPTKTSYKSHMVSRPNPALYLSQQWPKQMPFFSNSNSILKKASAQVRSEISANASSTGAEEGKSSRSVPGRPDLDRSIRRLNKCKLKHRSDFKIEDWTKYNHARSKSEADLLGLEDAYSCNPSVDRLRESRLSIDRFVRQYERTSTPVIVTGCADKWGARENWTFENLLARYGNSLLKCGEDDDGYKLKIKLKYFLEYLTAQKDDSPMYVFDNSFDEYPVAKQLMQDFEPPKYFREDLFHLVGEKPRPPYRWFLIGPKRSGTTVHIDPLGTSAWNTLIRGRKRWVLFPPNVSKEICKGRKHMKPGEDDEAIDYFTQILPRIKEALKGSGIPIIDFIQYPGDTIFVPGQWWHAVLNVDDTVAVTQNYCSSTNFPLVWRKTRRGRRKLAQKWLRKLEVHRPDLAAIAKELNEIDGWNLAKGMRVAQSRANREAIRKLQTSAGGSSGSTGAPKPVVDDSHLAKYGDYFSSSSSSDSSSSSSSDDDDDDNDDDDDDDGDEEMRPVTEPAYAKKKGTGDVPQ